MITVFFSPESDEGDIFSLFSLLSKISPSALHCSYGSIIAASPVYLLLPITSKSITVTGSCAAVLFNDSESASSLPEGCTVLCFCEKAATHCSGKGRQIISCGMHNKDTVTLSSLINGKPVLSLQRRLISFLGSTVEAGDYPLTTSEPNHRALMAAAALLLLSGTALTPDAFS